MARPTDFDAYVLRAIGVRDTGHGLSEAGIRETVDMYERLVLTTEEIHDSLARLSRVGLVILEAGRARLAPSLHARIPRTMQGEVTGAREPWERLAAEVLEYDPPAS